MKHTFSERFPTFTVPFSASGLFRFGANFAPLSRFVAECSWPCRLLKAPGVSGISRFALLVLTDFG